MKNKDKKEKCRYIHLAHAWKDGCTDPETKGECKTKPFKEYLESRLTKEEIEAIEKEAEEEIRIIREGSEGKGKK